MSAPGSVTIWIYKARRGDRQAAQELWKRYFRRLVGLARKKLANLRRGEDGEDVALSAFKSFYLRAEAGAIPPIDDRDGLWRMLVLFTSRKAANWRKFEGRRKRDWRKDRRASRNEGAETDDLLLAQAISREPDPAMAAAIADNVRRLLDHLGNKEFRTIALCKMEGFTNEQIAQQIGRSVATVERRLEAIRVRWKSLLDESEKSEPNTGTEQPSGH